MSPPGLINVYWSLVRPCFDYACTVYNSMLTASQSEAPERQQRKVLKVIYGWDVSYKLALARSGLDRLSARRGVLAERLAVKLAQNPRFNTWLPQTIPVNYALRNTKRYKEFPFRTERLWRAPLYLPSNLKPS